QVAGDRFHADVVKAVHVQHAARRLVAGHAGVDRHPRVPLERAAHLERCPERDAEGDQDEEIERKVEHFRSPLLHSRCCLSADLFSLCRYFYYIRTIRKAGGTVSKNGGSVRAAASGRKHPPVLSLNITYHVRKTCKII